MMVLAFAEGASASSIASDKRIFFMSFALCFNASNLRPIRLPGKSVNGAA
jgi:hypothetical protein